ncbi:hypothetical protein ZWY2020_024695 [Hordeum vulgare]|nr:hypothetical protein ZWY2020_024695 [Hordeum vulgare]
MAFRRAIVSLAVHSQASYCLHRAAASPPTLKPPPPPPPTLSCPVTVPCCSFATPPDHVKEVFKDNEGSAARLNNDITTIFLRLITDEGEARPGRRCRDGSLPLCALLIVLLCMAASLAEGRRGGGRSFIGGGSVGARGRASGSPRGLSDGTWAACVSSSLLVAADML